MLKEFVLIAAGSAVVCALCLGVIAAIDSRLTQDAANRVPCSCNIIVAGANARLREV